MKELKQMTSLHLCSILGGGIQVTDAGLKDLKELKQLYRTAAYTDLLCRPPEERTTCRSRTGCKCSRANA
jgi:hypothetical protein